MAAFGVCNVAEESIYYRFQYALGCPLTQRCQELVRLIEQCSLRDAHTLFPLLVESVFGFGSYPGWSLNLLCRHQQPREFDTVRQFLSPSGPVVYLAYQLMSDVYLKYEFPVPCLPSPVVRSLEEGVVPQFYVGKLQFSSPGHLPAVLSLNPFEFFNFHLSYFLISSQNHKACLDWNNASDTLYIFIMEDYLHFFLPCDGTYPPPPPYSLPCPMKATSPAQFKSSKGPGTPPKSIFRNPERDRLPTKNLLKQPVMSRQLSASGLQQHEAGQVDLWRSAVFLQVLVEFWLNHYSQEGQSSFRTQEKSLAFLSPRTSMMDQSWNRDCSPHRSANMSFTRERCSYNSLQEPFFPSTDHIRLIRMLIKHLHYFANSCQPNSSSAFDEFKRAVIAQLVRKRLYVFIRYMFNHWPLDASFRLVLEMWLSYIQPWRYTDCWSVRNPAREQIEEKDRVVLLRWQPFVEENLLFYSVFFQKMIPRLFRIDLCSLKNANMLHRLTKVFSQPNLQKMIREAESFVSEPSDRVGTILGGGVSSFSPVGHSIFSKSATEAGHTGVIRQHVIELEGAGHIFVPMFGEEVTTHVRQLLQMIQQVKATVISQGTSQSTSQRRILGSIVHYVSSFFHVDDAVFGEDSLTTNPHRVQQYLDAAAIHLTQLYPVHIHTTYAPSVSSASPEMLSSEPPDSLVTDDGILTTIGRYRLLNRLSKPKVSRNGDPDLQPIRSDEVAFLVRLFFQVASHVNEKVQDVVLLGRALYKYAAEIQELYNRNDFTGRLCRQFIQPPMVCYTFQHYGTPSPRHRKFLPPRISLRALGNKHHLGLAVAIYFVAYVFGHHWLLTSVVLVLIVLLFVVCTAAAQPYYQVRSF